MRARLRYPRVLQRKVVLLVFARGEFCINHPASDHLLPTNLVPVLENIAQHDPGHASKRKNGHVLPIAHEKALGVSHTDSAR